MGKHLKLACRVEGVTVFRVQAIERIVDTFLDACFGGSQLKLWALIWLFVSHHEKPVKSCCSIMQIHAALRETRCCTLSLSDNAVEDDTQELLQARAEEVFV